MTTGELVVVATGPRPGQLIAVTALFSRRLFAVGKKIVGLSKTETELPSGMWPKAKRAALRVLLIAAISYAAILALLVYNEPRLVYPGSRPHEADYAARPNDTEEVWIESFDGTRLHAWLLKSPAPQRTILFCHGNAENVAEVGTHFGRRLRDELQADVLVVDYRGFGLTGGDPHEQAVVDDCAAALKWLSQRTGLPTESITLFGRSLGGGIAVNLASRFGARELIIDRTFDSLVSPAACKFPWIPVSLLMRNRFPSDQLIASCRMPVFQTHFAADELIPVECARALFARVPNPDSEFHEIPGGAHLEPLPGSYWPALRNFLDRVDQP
jgi:pimeloyl-ACP methyl ester carboxylesterase